MTILNANEYITKGDVMQILQKAYTDGRIQAKDGCASVLDDIAAIKADVQPIKHGRWIAENRDKRGYADCYTCSNCNNYTYMYTLMKNCEHEYCPHCGARMDGDTE